MEITNLIHYQMDLLQNMRKAEINYGKTPKERIKQAYLDTRLEMLEQFWKDFREGHREIISKVSSKVDKERSYFTEKIYDQCEELYIQYKITLREALQTLCFPQHTSEIASKEIKRFNSEVKLPRVQLPTFSGKYEEWQTFYDMFSTLIHDNNSLSLVQKLQYLKSNLAGEPQSLICNFSTTEANYEEAWKQLVRRYNNKRYNCNTVLKNIFAQKKITTDSASAVRQLLDNTSSCLISLKNMGIQIDTWDIIIVFVVVSKLDGESIKLWEQKLSTCNDTLPTWAQLKEFLESRFRSMEMIDSSASSKSSSVQHTKLAAKPKSFHVAADNRSRLRCAMCQDDHYIYNCEQFGLLKPQERQDFVQNNKLCFNCLAPSHTVIKCRNRVSCKKCGRRHHTLLHFDKATTPVIESPAAATTSETKQGTNKEEVHVVANFSKQCSDVSTVLLATAKVKVMSKNSCKYVVRTLIDQGSQATFITESTVQLLGLSRKPVCGWVSGLGDGRTKIKYMVSLSLESCHNSNNVVYVNAFVLKSLTSFLPAADLHPLEWSEIEDLPLADCTFNNSGKIDLLLGADVYSEILQNGVLKHPTRNIVAQNTILGWIISGRVTRKQPETANNIISLHISLTTDEILKQFWEMENEPQKLEREHTPSEKKCEEYFSQTTTRDSEGRFVVRLPFVTDDPKCRYGNSKDISLKRLELLEKRLLNNENLSKEYTNVMSEYLILDHLVEVPVNEIANTKSVYLPHHAVVRDDKVTTKVRVVFDASCKDNNNISLNDELLVGPKLQQDLRHILMRWRIHKTVLVADIVKMYRMILVAEDETDYQRIVWRFSQRDPVKHYKLLRLTFGTACAPYLAVKCLQRLAEDEEDKYPLAAKITKTDFYMDDLISGADSTDEIIRIHEEMKSLMSCGGFVIQKWNSNDKDFLKYIGATDDEEHKTTQFNEANNVTKVLGVGWNRETDNFEYIVNLPEQTDYTKRQVVSDVARLYDPLGWIAPVVILAKAFIQKLWKSNLEWDDKLSQNLMREWISFHNSLTDLKELQIRRWVDTTKISKIQLHAFSDASKTGFAAAVYLRVVNEQEKVFVHLLTAKTKVAPLKEITIPRLELCGAMLAAKLILEVSQVLNVPKENLFGWTDSTIVLAWLKGGPSRWATFVSNRVSAILGILEYEQWGHVTSENNPADVASRGTSAKDLKNDSLWWTGPTWLREGVSLLEVTIEDTREEEKVEVLSVIATVEEEYIWSKFSNLQTTLKVISYCRRVLNLRLPKESREHYKRFITADEMKNALLLCVRQVQEHEYSDELNQLKSRGVVPKRSNLRTLYPICDANGILRVGGRITQSDAAYDVRHPMILPGKGHFTRLLILDAHHQTLHGGPQVMLNFLRSKYWIVRAKTEVKKIYRECVTCRRHSARSNTQLMGQIPEVRLKPSKPFRATGVDYAGPINIRFSPGRGAKSYKGYICLFVCMVTRAVHLEAVSDMSSKGFLAAFRRFTSRRGHCQDLYSDNGSNFVGADKLLKEMLNSCKSSLSTEIARSLALEGTTWHFIPPYAPNFGGLWEAGVRSTKNHLYRVIGNHTLTYEELSTVLTQVEACLNSRPISAISDSPNDPLPLTPGHFLIGEPLINIADQDYCEQNITGLDRWKLTQKIVRDFWNRWYREYLVTLSQRFKWNCKTNEPKLNAVVVLKEDNVPPAKWVLGRIIEKHPGPDNITRVVTVKCKNGIYKRPLSKMCVLCE